MTFVVAVDVGGTSMKAARVTADGAIVDPRSLPTPVRSGPEAVVQALRSLITSLAPGAAGVGVVVPGVVDGPAGVARYAANLGWRDVPLARLINDDVALPVGIGHDVRGAALAERTLGVGRGVDDFVLVIMGTGVACAIVSDGRPLRGASDLAGELGHVSVRPGAESCACGQRGCLELYASASGIARRYAARTGQAATAAEVAARLGSDPAAAAVWREAVDALALGLATTVLLLDPSLIVLGGGLAGAGAALRDPLTEALADHLRWRPAPPVEISPIADRLGLLGAGQLGWQVAGSRG